jgi:Fe-S oxidoreductase
MSTLTDTTAFGIWQGLLRVVGAFGDCPRCLAVCPVGDDYHLFLKEEQLTIPEKNAEKVDRARRLLGIRRKGEPIPAMQEGRTRWIGEAGYRPPAKAARST